MSTGGRVGFSEGDLALSELEGVKDINTVDDQVSTMLEKKKLKDLKKNLFAEYRDKKKKYKI